jgi:hypothetical protein
MSILITEKDMHWFENKVFERYIKGLTAQNRQNFLFLKVTADKEELLQSTFDIAKHLEKDWQTDMQGIIQFYSEMSIIFGFDFKDDPQYAWVKEILEQHTDLPVIDKFSAVYDQAADFLKATHGEKNEHLLHDLEAMTGFFEQRKDQPLTYGNMEHFIERMLPKRVAAMKQPSKIIHALAEKYRYTGYTEKEVVLTIIVTLLSGINFENSPYYKQLNESVLKVSGENSGREEFLMEFLKQWTAIIQENKGIFNTKDFLWV